MFMELHLAHERLHVFTGKKRPLVRLDLMYMLLSDYKQLATAAADRD